ncbi:hypothetical protein Pelo_1835 [Pelomyxa schiedti]|nr:hypothetical protein Pelo_1835 [Pelomyxa schiedti]
MQQESNYGFVGSDSIKVSQGGTVAVKTAWPSQYSYTRSGEFCVTGGLDLSAQQQDNSKGKAFVSDTEALEDTECVSDCQPPHWDCCEINKWRPVEQWGSLTLCQGPIGAIRRKYQTGWDGGGVLLGVMGFPVRLPAAWDFNGMYQEKPEGCFYALLNTFVGDFETNHFPCGGFFPHIEQPVQRNNAEFVVEVVPSTGTVEFFCGNISVRPAITLPRVDESGTVLHWYFVGSIFQLGVELRLLPVPDDWVPSRWVSNSNH